VEFTVEGQEWGKGRFRVRAGAWARARARRCGADEGVERQLKPIRHRPSFICFSICFTPFCL
jgi:hypothetical protein